jgi:PAS domain S-box-containing protein
MDLTAYAFQKLCEDSEFIVSRGRHVADNSCVLLLEAAHEHPSKSTLDQLHHTYSLAAELNSAWSARPLQLLHRHGVPALLLEDPGGEFLNAVLLRSPTLSERLLAAVACARALGRLHARRLIHRDINPRNILVRIATGEAWLTGFGSTTRLPRYHQLPEPPNVLAGTLAYMAPEQTGRMNRSIDSRSDLYSLGVTFYEMFVGALPFDAKDPMELVHCHIARLPLAPSLRQSAIPEQLSAVILKLLAKTPEDRYQTAAGVEGDLQRCISSLQAHGRVDRFPLGERDVPNRLLIPERLYGRETEVEILVSAFDRAASQGSLEVVLISGYSGVGKSSVVNESQKARVPSRGLFASGKFDQYRRDVPYATLIQAFKSLIRQVLSQSDAEIALWRKSLLENLGPNAKLMINLIPELELVMGEQPAVVELPPQDSKNRFHYVFQRLIQVFAQPQHPLSLFLDDLQWLDASTLRFLEHLISQNEVRHLLLIGAYRDNEVSTSHPLMKLVAKIRKTNVRIQQVTLAPLNLNDLSHFLGDSLHREPERTRSLALAVREKTGGNPFFTIQFMTELEEEGLFVLEPDTANWAWDTERIRAKGYTDNVVDLMVGKINRFPVATKDALKQLACLGNIAEFETLRRVCQDPNDNIHEQLWEAVRAGLLYRSEHTYSFAHDRVQEAAYSLIPEHQRAPMHLRIGKILEENTPAARLEEAIFDIVNQFNRAVPLLISRNDREHVGRLNLIAGQRAKGSTAYVSALKYLNAGRSLLTDATWEWDYALMFSIEHLVAECELLSAEMRVAEKRLSMLVGHAKTPHDVALIVRLQLTLYTTMDRSDLAIDVFLDYLRRAGTDWPKHPTHDDVSAEYNRIWLLLGSRRIEDLAGLPVVTNPDVLDMLDVFTEIVHPALFYDENLSSLVVCRMVTLSLENGNSDASCFGYVWFAMLAGPRFSNYKDGFRFGQLGYDLVEKHGFTRYQARTYLSFSTLMPWAKHALSARELVHRAFDVAHRTGDLTFSAYGWHVLITNYLTVGDALAEVQKEAENGLAFVRKAGFGLVAENCKAQLGLIRMLRGLTTGFGSLNDGDYNESETEVRLADNPVLVIAEFFYWTRKLQCRFFAGDYASAIDASQKAHRLLWTAASQVETGDFRFFAALAHAAAWNSASGAQRQEHLNKLRGHHQQLKTWAENCPANFENRTALVAAEIARMEGSDLEAMRLYEHAIRSAHAQGFVHYEAVAHEVASRFYAERGFERIAAMHLQDARHCYSHWGADGKVKHLEQSYPRLHEGRPLAASPAIGRPSKQLDVETVVKASQAISSEMVLPALIEKLVRIAVEHAGAERGLLILLRAGEPRIEAEAITGHGMVEVVVQHAAITSSVLPRSVLHYVTRTQESVLLDDALADSLYSKDEYVQLKGSRSVLCLPIVKQKKLIGALYLENNLAPFVFTPDRVTVLLLLASQAAISLENAALFTDLQLQVGLLQHLPVSTWTLEPDGTPDFVNQVWLDFASQTLDFVRSHPEAWMTAVHPEDRAMAAKVFWDGVRSGRGFNMETRSLRAQDGTYRWHLIQAVVLRDSKGKVLKFVGTTTDIDEQKRTEEALRRSQMELAHAARVTTMGVLAASIAHEVNQPLSGIITNASTCIRMLTADAPNVEGAIETARRTVRDGYRASEVIKRLRSLFSKKTMMTESVNLNEAAQDVIALSLSECQRNHITVYPELAEDLPSITGDRVQLQQVILNLLLNAVQAMSTVNDRPRRLIVRTEREMADHVRLTVQDTGVGLDAQGVAKCFDAFYTTKSEGMGIGLSVSRSIIESHHGRIWATPNNGPGAKFSFSIPLNLNDPT